MTIDERVERLTGIVESLAPAAVAHDNQIEALIIVSERNAANWERLERSMASLERQWQAYLNTLPRQ
jgi:hypothetical protein